MTDHARRLMAVGLGWLVLGARLLAQNTPPPPPPNTEPERQSIRVPNYGMRAAGGTIAFTQPFDSTLLGDLGMEAYGELYFTPRLSIRLTFGRVSPISDFEPAATIHTTYVDPALVYNWEGGAWHPYVAAGLGVYRFHSLGTANGTSHTEKGFYGGAGVEYFARRKITIRAGADVHRVSNGGYEPIATSFVILGIGMKFYF